MALPDKPASDSLQHFSTDFCFAMSKIAYTIFSAEPKYPIDESRIYVVGFSLGASGTTTVASYDHPVYGRYGRFASMAPMSGGNFPANGGFSAGVTPEVKIPFFNTYGERETFGLTQAQRVIAFNGVNVPEGDNHTFWRMPVNEPELVPNGVGDITTTTFYDDTGIPCTRQDCPTLISSPTAP